MPFLSRRGAGPDVPALPYDPASPEGLAARWVLWVAAAGVLSNPVEDENGRYATQNQPDDIWFLAGSSGKTVERRCGVPADRDLFLPAFNMWYFPADGPPPRVDDGFGSLVVDGAAIELDEISTPVPFTVAGARLNGVTGRKRPMPVTVWGLWKRIPALSPGEHVIQVRGGDGHGFVLDVTYRVVAGVTTPAYPIG